MSKEQRTQVVDWASDKELADELIRRCQRRLEQPITSTADEKILRLMYDVGKLLLIRSPVHRRGE